MSETIEELKELHLMNKPQLKQALVNIEKIIHEDDGESALFAIEHLSDAIESMDGVIDRLFTEIESLKAITELAVKGLQWYADKKNWNLGVNISMGSAHPLHEAIKSDKGNIAKSTLSEIERLSQ